MKKDKNLLAIPAVMVTLAILTQGLWGIVFPVIKKSNELFHITELGDTFLFAGLRFTFAGLLLLLVATFKEKKFPLLNKQQFGSVLLLGSVQTGLAYAFQFAGMITAASINCSILNGLAVIISTVIAHFLFADDRMTWRKAIGCIVGASGVVVCFLWGGNLSGFTFKGEGLVLLSIIVFVSGTNLSRFVTRNINPLIASGYNLLIGGLELLLVSLLLGGKLENGGLLGWSCLLFLALCSSICLLLWTALVKANTVSKIAVFQCVNPITGAIFASLLLGENVLQPKYIISIILVTLGIMIITKTTKKA